MHLEKPYLSNIGSGRAPKLPQTKQLQAARLEHEKFLRKQGLHPDQLSARKPNKQRLAADNTVAKTGRRIDVSDRRMKTLQEVRVCQQRQPAWASHHVEGAADLQRPRCPPGQRH